MPNMIRRFIKCESGAVTVDWVVLTAAIVGIGFGVMAKIGNGTQNVGSNLSDAVASIDVDAGQ